MATKIQWQPKFQLQLSSNGNISSNGNKSSNGNECNPRGLASYEIWACFKLFEPSVFFFKKIILFSIRDGGSGGPLMYYSTIKDARERKRVFSQVFCNMTRFLEKT